MYRMSLRNCTALLALALAIGTALFAGPASAGGLQLCDDCANPRTVALASGPGITLVADLKQRRLYGFSVEYDRELRRNRAIPTPVPEQVTAAFNRIMGMLDNPQIQAVPAQGMPRGLKFDVHPDDPQGANGITFPEEHKGLIAHDVTQMATARFRLEQQLGEAFAGANTSSAAWNAVATTLSSIGLAFVSKLLGIDGAVYEITWRDGSKTTMIIRPGSPDRAEYVQGGSMDADGNRIADAAASNAASGPQFIGVYNFSDDHSLTRWVDTARPYGVKVVRGSGRTQQMDCYWDGETLTCSGG